MGQRVRVRARWGVQRRRGGWMDRAPATGPGLARADAGQGAFEAQPAPPLGALHAWRSRIATVFQHSMVVPDLTVAENVFLGHQPGPGGLVDWRRMREQAQQIMADWGFRLDVGRPCSSLTVEQRQIVEIARALAAGTRWLLLDERPAALERAAVERLFSRVRQLVSSGVAVLYISHHHEEVFEICQDATVIRDGEIVLTAPIKELSKEELIAAMVGRARARAAAAESAAATDGTGRTAAGGAADRDASAAMGTANAPGPLAAAAAGPAGAGATAPCLVLEDVFATSAAGSGGRR